MASEFRPTPRVLLAELWTTHAQSLERRELHLRKYLPLSRAAGLYISGARAVRLVTLVEALRHAANSVRHHGDLPVWDTAVEEVE